MNRKNESAAMDVLALDIGAKNMAYCRLAEKQDTGEWQIKEWACEAAAEGNTIAERVRGVVKWFHRKDWSGVTVFAVEQQNCKAPTNYALHMVLYALLIRRYPKAKVVLQPSPQKYSYFGVGGSGHGWRQRKNLSVTIAKALFKCGPMSLVLQEGESNPLFQSGKKDDFADSLNIAVVEIIKSGSLKGLEMKSIVSDYTVMQAEIKKRDARVEVRDRSPTSGLRKRRRQPLSSTGFSRSSSGSSE